jgi:uncharacterized linocin/CFP29 family protein
VTERDGDRFDHGADSEVDRRAVFFLFAAVVCALLVPVADGYGWVAAVVSVVYLTLAAVSWLDHRSRSGGSGGSGP